MTKRARPSSLNLVRLLLGIVVHWLARSRAGVFDPVSDMLVKSDASLSKHRPNARRVNGHLVRARAEKTMRYPRPRVGGA